MGRKEQERRGNLWTFISINLSKVILFLFGKLCFMLSHSIFVFTVAELVLSLTEVLIVAGISSFYIIINAKTISQHNIVCTSCSAPANAL